MGKVKLAVVFPVLLFILMGLMFAVWLARENPEELPSVFIDQPVPALPEETIEGYAGYDPALLAGEGYKLVNFWASWCPPCRAEHPNLMELAQGGMVIIGVNKEDRPENAAAFLSELGNPYAGIAVDPRGRYGVDWGVYGLPETFLVDGDGRIRHRYPGAITERVWRERFMPIIQSLEAEK
jgi:cytochrome c biogenesis protein CcmG/thiol:disulfide interchange protein DsbE